MVMVHNIPQPNNAEDSIRVVCKTGLQSYDTEIRHELQTHLGTGTM
jgi:hypothetical protein